MYSRYADKSDYSFILLDKQDGDGAGIKSVMFQINGLNAYGRLKHEMVFIDLLELVLLILIRGDILHLLLYLLCLKLIRILMLKLMIKILE